MVRLESKLSSKNQITVPGRIRERLGIGALDSLTFVIKGDVITVEAGSKTFEDYCQSVPVLQGRRVQPEPELEELMDLAGEAQRINEGRPFE